MRCQPPPSLQTSGGCQRSVSSLRCFLAFQHRFWFGDDLNATSLLTRWRQTHANLQRGQTESPRKPFLAAGESRCCRKRARKGQTETRPSSGVGFQPLTRRAEGCLRVAVFNTPQESFLISICPIADDISLLASLASSSDQLRRPVTSGC